jgi:hypothetical protein
MSDVDIGGERDSRRFQPPPTAGVPFRTRETRVRIHMTSDNPLVSARRRARSFGLTHARPAAERKTRFSYLFSVNTLKKTAPQTGAL